MAQCFTGVAYGGIERLEQNCGIDIGLSVKKVAAMVQKSIDEVLAGRKDTYVKWLRDLCRVEGVSTRGLGIEPSVEAVCSLIEVVGGRARVLRLPEANPAILAEFEGESDRTLLFYNHYDVQPADPLSEWDYPPFEGVVRGGLFYARGAADNKGDLVSRLAAIDTWQRAHGRLPCRVKFLIEGEEEIGSPNLERYLQEYADLLQADACIWKYGNRDPGERLEIGLGLKGLLFVELTVEIAKSDLHSGYGALVEAASNRLVRALATLRDGRGQVLIPGFYDAVQPPGPKVRATLEGIPFEDEVLRERYGIKRFLRDRMRTGALATLVLEPTCTICGIESGYTGEGLRTVLPRQAKAKVEFRLVCDQSPEELLGQLRRHLDMKGFSDVQIRTLAAQKPFQTPMDHPFVQLVRDVAEEVTGREVVLYPNFQYSGPMHEVAKYLNAPIVSVGVGYWDRRAHAPNENIRLSDFEETIRFMARLLSAFSEADTDEQ